MGSCGSDLNCRSAFDDVLIEVIPDIVGIGILVAFLATSVSALLLIIYAYLKHCLPSDVLTWADLGFLQNWHLCKKCRKRFTFIVESRIPDPDTFCKHTNLYRDTRRRKALGAFLLTLSDQQLVVGPAVMIGALAQRCRLSCYEFQMVRNLAMRASVAHLSTLIALRDYLVVNTVVRDIRVVGMLVNLCLLVYTVIVAGASELVHSSARVQCVMDDLSILLSDPASFALAILWTILLISQYFSGITDLYAFEYNKALLRWLCCDPKKKYGLTESEFEEWYERRITESIYNPESDARREYYWLRTVDINRRFPRWYTFVAVLYDYLMSVLVNPELLLFNCSYGVAQIISTKMAPPRIKNNTNAIDFGQVVPLCLLLIPVLAGFEAYYDADLAWNIDAEETITGLHTYNSREPRSILDRLRHRRLQQNPRVLPPAPTPQDMSQPTSQGGATLDQLPVSPDFHESPNNNSSTSREDVTLIVTPEGTSASSTQGISPGEENEIEPEKVELPGIARFTERGRRLVTVYSWARTKKCLNMLFGTGVSVSVWAGIGMIYSIYHTLPWLCWALLCSGVRISVYLRHFRKSWVMSKDLLASLEGVSRFRRAEVIERAISGTNGTQEGGEDPVVLTREPEAMGTSFDSREGQEMDSLVREAPVLSRRTTWANHILEDLDEVGHRRRRMDTEEAIGL